MSDEKIVYRLEKNKREEVCFRIFNFKNKDYFDIRTYTDVVGEVDKKPTKKGVSFRLDQVNDVIEGLNKIKKCIEEEMKIEL